MKVYAASDHAGFALKQALVAHLGARGVEVVDLGPASNARTDYPDFAARAAREVVEHPGSFGLLVCGSGVGMSIAANKVPGIRAVNAWTVEVATLARGHNDANVICFGERLVAQAVAVAALDAFLAAPFEGGRHAERVAKIERIARLEDAKAAAPRKDHP